MSEITGQKLLKGSEVWVATDGPEMWEKATVLANAKDANSKVFVSTKGGKKQNTLGFLVNPKVEGDMTALWHIHEPGILYNLEKRSFDNAPYTFMGPVLVAVNPLKRIKDPEGTLGTPKASSVPHPFAIAETSYQQLKFACSRVEADKKSKKKEPSAEDEPMLVNQSIVVGGESGAGKTESSKMVLRHLVERCGGGGIDAKLLSSNPILEAFGNAATLRNPNSSRFGKFMKLHFGSKAKKIITASIETYLLERSRITTHEEGERGYHVFYQLIAGCSGALKKSLGLTGDSFKYLGDIDTDQSKTDKANFKELNKAFNSVGLGDKTQEKIFRIVAAVLHLGNIHFDQVEKSEGDVAVVKSGKDGPAKWAAGLLGIEKGRLIKLFCEREVQAAGETMVTYRNAEGASYARDAVAKAVYSRLFDHILKLINECFLDDVKESSVEALPFIGVLDIFGFESFKKNDFEQLLINYTNEALQQTFNRQVFEAEAELYKREGLVINTNEKIAPPPNNQEGMTLLVGILNAVDAEGRMPQASDNKLNEVFHRTFNGKNACFLKVHPKDRQHTFAVFHYAGAVTYTVGTFLQKNSDRLPSEVDVLFETSEETLLADLWGGKLENENAALLRSLKKNTKTTTIISKFKGQIVRLVQTLDSTRCSFIRCVKPNSKMKRDKGSNEWFDRGYVSMQLKCLSIPQTAEVLKTGLPTRITYAALVQTYTDVLPKKALRCWKTLGGGSESGFVAALFWAFEIQRGDYKLGLTRVFFRSGMLATLDKILSAATQWSDKKKGSKDKDKDKIVKRFQVYHARRRWRVCYAKVISTNRFLNTFLKAKSRGDAVVMIQSNYRAARERKKFLALRRGAVAVQTVQRGRIARTLVDAKREKRRKKLKEEEEKARKKAAKAKEKALKLKKEEEAAKKKAEELKKKENAAQSKKEKKKLEEQAAEANKYAEEQGEKVRKLKAEQEKAEKHAVILEQTREEADREITQLQRKQTENLQARQATASKALQKQDQERRERNEQKANSDKERRKTINRRSTAMLQNVINQKMRGTSMRVEAAPPTPGPPLKGEACKLAVKSQRNWKRRFFVLDRAERTIKYYKKEGEKKEKGMFVLFPTKHSPRPKLMSLDVHKKKKHVLEIKGGHTGDKVFRTMYMAFDSRGELSKWEKAVQESMDGYESRKVMSHNSSQFSIDTSSLSDSNAGGGSGADGVPQGFLNAGGGLNLNLHAEALAQLQQLEDMLFNGDIDEKTFNELLPTVVDEITLANSNGPSAGQVVCSNLQCTNQTNTRWETSCRECNSKLQVQILDDDVYEEERPTAPLIGNMPWNGGTLLVFYKGHDSVMDHWGSFHRSYFVICRFERGSEPALQWTINYRYSGYRALRKVLKRDEDDDTMDGATKGTLPKLPKRRRKRKPDETGSTVHVLPAGDRTKYLRSFLTHLFQLGIASEVNANGDSCLLAIKPVDAFFQVSRNTVDAVAPSYLSEDQELAQLAHGPMDESELVMLEKAVNGLYRMCKDKSADKVTMAQFREICTAFRSRLKLSTDPENAFVLQELVDQAVECQIMLDKALELYDEQM